MQLIPPFWFKQRQAKIEPVDDSTCKVSAPNSVEAYLLVRQNGERWSAAVRRTPDGPDLAATAFEFSNPATAWEAAFELYRRHVVC